jgi:hypothetical protein
MGLQSQHVHANDSGFFVLPKSALQTIDGHKTIFINLGNNQFAMRYIEVVQDSSDSIWIHKNLNSEDAVITVGTDKLKTGVLRKWKGHHGHTHGPGGHTH